MLLQSEVSLEISPWIKACTGSTPRTEGFPSSFTCTQDRFSRSPTATLLIIQDTQLHADGSINFPTIGVSPKVHPSWCPEYYGDTIIVNGKAWPYMNVYPIKYRFRMLNAANARYFVMTLSHPKLRFYQIGTDGGYLEKPLKVKTLTMGPAERLDFIIDFSKSSKLENPPQVQSDSAPENFTLPQFDIPSSDKLGKRVKIRTSKDTKVRRLTLTEYDDGNENPVGSLLNGLRWRDPVTKTPELNSTEIWEIINLTEDAHPIHIHLVAFRVKLQQSFDIRIHSQIRIPSAESRGFRIRETLHERVKLQTRSIFLEDELRKIRESLHNCVRELETQKELHEFLELEKASLSQERDMQKCLMCKSNIRNTIIFPCMHFLYYSDCLSDYHPQRRSNECPTCGSPVGAAV
ncbi:hypothetical protein R1flu_028298 [Riccia fluitans]|uniref:RING-type domain-containing protein n=1 Tax=Riccia fluitans TaxID=41844 RepID=A0ABD1XL97_9MARC